MEKPIPYLASPGSAKTALDKIRQAATPDRVTQDFVTTKIGIKGGTGAALIPFFKRIGLLNSDGTPSDLYKQFRNPATGGLAIASAIKNGYKMLGEVNEYFYDLNDKDLKALIVQVTGTEPNGAVARLALSTLKILKGYADFEAKAPGQGEQDGQQPTPQNAPASSTPQPKQRELAGISLSYTINLNLPSTSEQAVFNAIFRSLKEHLLSNA